MIYFSQYYIFSYSDCGLIKIKNERCTIFIDPTDWTKDHVSAWLKWCSNHLELWPLPRPEDFPDSGRELCSLSRLEFNRRSRNKRSGRLLLLHLSLLRQPVTGTPPSPSLTTPDEGKRLKSIKFNHFIIKIRNWDSRIKNVFILYRLTIN